MRSRWARFAICAVVAVTAIVALGAGARWTYCDLTSPNCIPTAEPDDLEAELFVTEQGWVNFRFRSTSGERKVAWQDFSATLPDGMAQVCEGDDSAFEYVVESEWEDFYVACTTEHPPGEYALTYQGEELNRLTVE